jgi:formamidopyrimidine-DNA glycosylase
MTQMWGAMELYEQGEELLRPYVAGMRSTPVDPEWTWGYFDQLVTEIAQVKKRSVKGLLTQEQIIPGLGNSIAQDILFRAGLHPKRLITELKRDERRVLFDTIGAVLNEVIACGGLYDEVDLYGKPGGYVRLMDKNSAGWPCRRCGTTIQKAQFLGGACSFCPQCPVSRVRWASRKRAFREAQRTQPSTAARPARAAR